MRASPVLVTVLACAAACRATPTTALAGAGSSPATPPAVTAELVAPQAVRRQPEVSVTGNLKALSAAQLAMPLAGTLAKVLVKRGDVVREGAVLAVLDDAAARASVAQAEAGVAAGRAQLALADDALARVERLHGQESASESQLVQSRAQRDLAWAQLSSALAQRDQAGVQLRYQSLRAPFDGVVIRVPDGVGFAVSPAVPLFAIEAVHTLVMETSATQDEASRLAVGMHATVTVPATGASTDQAVIRVVVPSVDPATNRVPIELTVPNADGRFLAHAFARAHLVAGAAEAAWKVPAAALTQREGAFAVWLADSDGRAHARAVRVFAQDAQAAVVDPGPSGWPAGARVVATPPLGIGDGMLLATEKSP